MTRRLPRHALAACTLSLALSALGCVLPGSSTSSVGDGGCADDAGQRVNDQCLAVYTELCKQAGRCSINITSISDCVTSGVAAYCCVGSACNAWSCQAPAQVMACQADIDTEDCNGIVNNVTPPSCATFTTAM